MKERKNSGEWFHNINYVFYTFKNLVVKREITQIYNVLPN